ncbi:G kinase-anchoring protein 1-like [Saccoglossus kowalevskii]|uniref:G kinase-anchoring protein 1-B-like n=1 Tax=Saccoglossus kowalevskii TaxID=10224 RepID=A0ABM0MX15_SACKO|nr:PREDICTED: G kinase-anchoring protein 1-B-like [Saccoglossus kowalevskii]
MASLTASRFAVLHVEDDDSDQELQTQTKKDEGKQTKSAGAKKRARKKKKNQQINAENAQLRDLAFSKIPSKTQACTIAPNPARSTKTESGKTVGENGRQWKQWSEKDKEFVSDQFEKDLEKAILQSKIDFEKQASKAKRSRTLNSRYLLLIARD